jgi:hypothetical protein
MINFREFIDNQNIQWYWHQKRFWRPYSPEESEVIEKAYQKDVKDFNLEKAYNLKWIDNLGDINL